MTYMVVRAYRDGQYVAGQSPVAPDQVDAVKDAFANRYPGTVLRVAPCSYQPPPVAPAAAETEGVDGSELGNLLTIFRSDKLGIELDERQAELVLAEWHAATHGLKITRSHPGLVGVSAYRWVTSKAGLAKRGIPTAAPLSPEALELVYSFAKDLVRHPDYVDPKRRPKRGQQLVEVDVNGHFHASAGIRLGTGDPVHVTDPQDIGAYANLPGYLRLAADMRSKHPAWQGLRAGETIAITTANWLVKYGFDPPQVSEALIWTQSRHHLESWYELFRDARTVLMGRAKSGSVAAGYALKLLKLIVTLTLGGFLRSQDTNHSEMLRYDWADMIVAEAWVRQMVAMAKAETLGAWPIGVWRDGAFFTTTDQSDSWVPPGLQLSEQLGKWKIAARVPVTAEIVAAHRAGPKQLVQAVRAAQAADHTDPAAPGGLGLGQP